MSIVSDFLKLNTLHTPAAVYAVRSTTIGLENGNSGLLEDRSV